MDDRPTGDPAPPVVVVGEGLVDVLPDGRAVPGGAPVNVAVGSARLDVPVAWVGPLGRDEHARVLEAHLATAGVRLDRALRVPFPTSRAVVELDAAGHATYTFHLDGTGNRQVEATPDRLGPASAVVVVGGAIAFDDPPFGTSMAITIGRTSSPVWLDPNVRAGASRRPGQYRRLVDDLVADATVVKAADEDLGQLARPGEDPLDVARAWASSGPALVVVTLGGEGLLALRPDRPEVRVPGVEVEVVDTVGAGDTVTAALVAWAHEHGALGRRAIQALDDADVEDALAFAARAAAVTCSRPGADPPTRAQLV